MKCAGHVVRMEEMRNEYKIFVGKSEGNRPRVRLRRRWEDNIRRDLREIGGKVWIGTSGWLLWTR